MSDIERELGVDRGRLVSVLANGAVPSAFVHDHTGGNQHSLVVPVKAACCVLASMASHTQ